MGCGVFQPPAKKIYIYIYLYLNHEKVRPNSCWRDHRSPGIFFKKILRLHFASSSDTQHVMCLLLRLHFASSSNTQHVMCLFCYACTLLHHLIRNTSCVFFCYACTLLHHLICNTSCVFCYACTLLHHLIRNRSCVFFATLALCFII